MQLEEHPAKARPEEEEVVVAQLLKTYPPAPYKHYSKQIAS